MACLGITYNRKWCNQTIFFCPCCLPFDILSSPSIHLATRPPTFLLTVHHLFIHPPIHPSTQQSSYPSIHSSISPPLPPFTYTYFYPSIHPSIHPFTHPSFYASINSSSPCLSSPPLIHPLAFPVSIHPTCHPPIHLPFAHPSYAIHIPTDLYLCLVFLSLPILLFLSTFIHPSTHLSFHIS